jgi:hypothetical protein
MYAKYQDAARRPLHIPLSTFLTISLSFSGSVWIAASSVRGLQGYGVFTTRDLAKDESILGVPDGVSIPITGYRQRHIPEGSNLKEAWIKVWYVYCHLIHLVFSCISCLILYRKPSSGTIIG